MDRWHRSVAFKLSVAMFAIAVFVMMLQASTWLQIHRLSEAQASITTTSVPLLDKSQEFARLTSRVLAKTALLENDLTREELLELREQYFEDERRAEAVLSEMAATFVDESITLAFRANRDAFKAATDRLFENQFQQRDQEQQIAEITGSLLSETLALEDMLDRLLIQVTTSLLINARNGTETANSDPKLRNAYLEYAAEIETLNTLKGTIFGISNLLRNPPTEGGVEDFDKSIRFRIRSLSQSLILLPEGQERTQLARRTNTINEMLTASGGLVEQLAENLETRGSFNRLKREQATALERLDASADQIVDSATSIFNVDIATASAISRSIIWTGLIVTIAVALGILVVNHHMIRRLISARFTILTEDVLAISGGDYEREITVAGSDEIGDIAKALDVFKNQAAELKRSNADLERFAYVAAHDLRSPLQAIQDLAIWTLEDEREALSEECIENLELMIKRSSRLAALQTDLLTYAKVSDMDTSIAAFSLKSEVDKLADMLDPNNHFDIQLVGDPGLITTYALPTRQILLNLLTNAIKHHDRNQGSIVVRYDHAGEAHRLTVEDDGPGIEPRFQEKIFELFKTLKSRDLVEGSGLGLALVSKMIERLDGTLTVHSDAPERRGSRFVFEIADLEEVGRTNEAAA